MKSDNESCIVYFLLYTGYKRGRTKRARAIFCVINRRKYYCTRLYIRPTRPVVAIWVRDFTLTILLFSDHGDREYDYAPDSDLS